MHRLILCSLLALGLAACSNGEAPKPAEFVQPVPTRQDFGDLRVHFNAIPSQSLTAPVAKEYGVRREEGTALVVIAIRRVAANEEVPATGAVTAKVRDLSGGTQELVFREAHTGEYVDYIATMKVSARDTYRFDVAIQADGKTGQFQFQRNF
ncbi:DUF4426 domain-containing protein [Pseudoxanthomonas indica]|uniref:DUF4426 domain-containing protein n=1 Tax=Pseudoxanthomonas indica TaxID=428993 RepID=A0A1T5LJW5_9GAMM|nr:DUF4426 domain-containing protein [Pseudoxanthomonas indica]GGD36161.1 hypothetical protein GCM10007235_05150 [Pseudoxanthomonas indica]SKC76260.1 protein of unknown function [Pseudoxanthomonas indica]